MLLLVPKTSCISDPSGAKHALEARKTVRLLPCSAAYYDHTLVQNSAHHHQKIIPLKRAAVQFYFLERFHSRCDRSPWKYQNLIDCVPEANATKSQIDQKWCDKIRRAGLTRNECSYQQRMCTTEL